MSKPQAAKEFLQAYLPEDIKKIVNLDTLQLQQNSFIDEQLQGHLVDLLYSVNFNDQQGYIYLLFEHLSNPDKMIAFRLLKYMINIMEYHIKKHKTQVLPIVYPFIIYTGKSAYNYSTNLFDLFAKHKNLAEKILFKSCEPINIQDISDEVLRQQVWFGVMCKIFKINTIESITLARVLIPNFAKMDQPGDVEFINFVVKYILITRKIDDKDRFFKTLTDNLSTEVGGKIMTAAEELIQEGMQKGAQTTLEKVVLSMLKQHMSVEQIINITHLPMSKIKELAAKQQKH
jgi:predicted transposase/invertase (TIGR01784 family)